MLYNLKRATEGVLLGSANALSWNIPYLLLMLCCLSNQQEKGLHVYSQTYNFSHIKDCLGLFHFGRSPQKPKSFQDSLSHQILRHMHEALNIDENKN
jgi:hypothetical protein